MRLAIARSHSRLSSPFLCARNVGRRGPGGGVLCALYFTRRACRVSRVACRSCLLLLSFVRTLAAGCLLLSVVVGFLVCCERATTFAFALLLLLRHRRVFLQDTAVGASFQRASKGMIYFISSPRIKKCVSINTVGFKYIKYFIF